MVDALVDAMYAHTKTLRFIINGERELIASSIFRQRGQMQIECKLAGFFYLVWKKDFVVLD